MRCSYLRSANMSSRLSLAVVLRPAAPALGFSPLPADSTTSSRTSIASSNFTLGSTSGTSAFGSTLLASGGISACSSLPNFGLPISVTYFGTTSPSIMTILPSGSLPMFVTAGSSQRSPWTVNVLKISVQSVTSFCASSLVTGTTLGMISSVKAPAASWCVGLSTL